MGQKFFVLVEKKIIVKQKNYYVFIFMGVMNVTVVVAVVGQI